MSMTACTESNHDQRQHGTCGTCGITVCGNGCRLHDKSCTYSSYYDGSRGPVYPPEGPGPVYMDDGSELRAARAKIKSLTDAALSMVPACVAESLIARIKAHEARERSLIAAGDAMADSLVPDRNVLVWVGRAGASNPLVAAWEAAKKKS